MAGSLRFGVVGAGLHCTRRVLPVIARLPGVELEAVCDLDRARAEGAARQFGANAAYTDHREMLAAGRLDGLIICVDPRAHAQLAIEGLQAGLPVYTEKPPAVSAHDAREVWQVSRMTGQRCMTGFRKRFSPVYARAREIIHLADFGAPMMLSGWRSAGSFHHHPDQPASWFLLDMGIHILDLVRFLLGEVDEVSAVSRGRDAYAVTLKFRNGALGSLALVAGQSWAWSTERIEVAGESASTVRVVGATQLLHVAGGAVASYYEPNYSTAMGDSLVEGGFIGELTEFASAIRENRELISDIGDAVLTMELYEAVSTSASAAGRTVALDRGHD